MSWRRRLAPERLSGLHDLQERFAHVGAVNSVLVDQESGEDGVVQCSAGFVVGVPVEQSDIGEQTEALGEDFGTRGECSAAVGVIGLQASDWWWFHEPTSDAGAT